MMKLFAVYVGGDAPGANIEVHDMRFVVAPSITDTYDELRRQWWGTPSSLHVDCWAEIDQVDGFDVTLRPEPTMTETKLYYVNLGGYDRSEFLEKHRNVFVVAGSLKDAKAQALTRGAGWTDLHRDDFYEAEQAFALDQFDGEPRQYIHLRPTDAPREIVFTCRYTPIGTD